MNGILLALSIFFASVSPVTVRETSMPARYGLDNWVSWCGLGFGPTNDAVAVTMKRTSWELHWDCSTPGPPRLRADADFIFRFDTDLKGVAHAVFRMEKESEKETNSFLRLTGDFGRECRFHLPGAKGRFCYLESFDVCALPPDAVGKAIRFLGVDAVTRETAAEALRTDVETGNPFHFVRDGRNEEAVLVCRNPSDRALVWNVTLTLEDYFGRRRNESFPVSLAAGRQLRKPLGEPFGKGIRYVTVVAESEGTVATNRTTWAYVDAHDTTPLAPAGEFRPGVNYHIQCYTPGWRELCNDALVAIGAKLVRSGCGLAIGTAWPDGGEFRFDEPGRMVDSLISRGIAVNIGVGHDAKRARAAKDGDVVSLRLGILRTYGEAVARRFGRKIAYYELGNEWDFYKESAFPYADAVREMREFAEGVHAGCPGAKVIPVGWACEGSAGYPPDLIRPGFHENAMTELKDVVDIHAVHGHGNYKDYTAKMSRLLDWRRERGIEIPWYANESAISTAAMKPNDREAGKLVWQKILWSWVRGSADYIWYNLRASGFRPRDNEQGYGIFTPDLHPRCAAAAFAAFTAAFAELRADRILRDGPERQVYRFAGRRSGKDVRVIAGWDAFAREGAEIRVRTDAESAIRIDTMGGRTASSLNDGVAIWTVSADPSVLLLTGATEAEPDGNDLANDAPRPVKTITPGPEFNDQENADIILKDYDQVYELYKAMPQHQDRQWKWWNDLWVWTCFAWKDGRLKIRVRVWDDVHTPRPDDPLEGDAVVLKLGDWTLALVTGSDDRLRILGRPAGIGDPPRSAWTFVGKYDLELDPKAFGLGCEIPFNIRVYDNDGKGLEGWMEPAPFDGPPPCLIRLSR